jgi:GH24 family phage-related lysozyme (muramidase)
MAVLDWLGMGITGRGRMNKKAIVAIALGLGGLWLLMARAQKAGETQTQGGFFLPDVFGFIKAAATNIYGETFGYWDMQPSPNIKEKLKREESLGLASYETRRGNGDWTIGYGHKVTASDPYFPRGQIKNISLAQAEALFEQDCSVRAKEINKRISASLSQPQYDAIFEMYYVAPKGARQAIVAANEGRHSDAESILRNYVGANQMAGHAARFGRIADMYRSGIND